MLKLFPQEINGNYNFTSVRPTYTMGFLEAFGHATMPLIFSSLEMIRKQHPSADYLQVFEYNNVKYYCISMFENDKRPADYGIDYLYCTFMLATEY